MPAADREHLLQRMHDREIGLEELNRLRLWLESQPEVLEVSWYKDFGSFKLCGEGMYSKTFLLLATGNRNKALIKIWRDPEPARNPGSILSFSFISSYCRHRDRSASPHPAVCLGIELLSGITNQEVTRLKFKGILLSAAMLFAFGVFAQPTQTQDQTQQEKSAVKSDMGQAKAQYGQMQSTLQQMKDDEGKVNDQSMKDYMQKNNQMWEQALQQEKEMGQAAKQMHRHHKQKMQEQGSSNPQ